MTLPDFLNHVDDEIRLTGHRIRLIDIAQRYEEGHSAETILLDFYPTLTLPLVYKAIAHYLDNRTEVQEMIDADRAALDAAEAAQVRKGPTLAELRGRLQRRLGA